MSGHASTANHYRHVRIMNREEIYLLGGSAGPLAYRLFGLSNTNVMAIAVDAQDDVWATLQPPLHIVQIDGDTGALLANRKVCPTVGLSASLAMDPLGDLYAGDGTGTLVYRIDAQTGTVLASFPSPGGFGTSRPGLALDPTGQEL